MIISLIKKYITMFIQSRKCVKTYVFCALSIIAIMCSFLFAGATLGLRVDYNGKVIATVKNKSDFDDAVTLVSQSVCGSDVASEVNQPVYSTALVLSSDIDDSIAVAQAIIDNTDSIISVRSLSVDGEIVAYSNCGEVDQLLENRLNSFVFKDLKYKNEFYNQVKSESTYCLESELTSYTDICEIISKLSVKSIVSTTYDKAIPFSTQTKENSSMLRGNTKVVSAGKNGTEKVTENIIYTNGSEVSREAVSSEIVAQPTTKVVEVGTAKSIVSDKDKRIAKNSGFIFPLPRCGWVVSAYFGDGRNHQAVDIACDKGTDIYAVKSGTVVSAGYDGNYGLSIVIDHGNGVQTRYAHESEIYVKAGDKIKSGECIGAVGRTGNASGNHLHFEVIRNGKRVDPAPYIGLS